MATRNLERRNKATRPNQVQFKDRCMELVIQRQQGRIRIDWSRSGRSLLYQTVATKEFREGAHLRAAHEAAVEAERTAASLFARPTITKFSEDQLKMICAVVENVWNAIGGDVEDAARSCGSRLSNKGAIETSLDAGYPCIYGGPKGKEVDVMMGHYTGNYDDLLAILSRRVRLV